MSGARSRSGSATTSASPPPKTPLATATVLGCSVPLGLPMAFTDPVARPLEELVSRFARTHGPFVAADVGQRFGAPVERIEGAIAALAGEKRVVLGEFRPDGVQREWCDVNVLRQLRRRSLAVLRKEVEPVEQDAFGRFLPAWHSIPPERRGMEALVDAVGMLAGAPIVASMLERDVLAVALGRLPPVDARRTVYVRRGRLDGCRHRSAPGTVGSGCASRIRSRCSPPGGKRETNCRVTSTRRCARSSPSGVRASGGNCARRSRTRPTPNSWWGSGIWCGPGRSPTTRWHRCVHSSRAVASPRRNARRGAAVAGPVPAG